MKTNIKYLKKSDRYNYMVDRLVIYHTFEIDNKYLKHIRDNRAFIHATKTKVVVKRGRCQFRSFVIFQTSHNMNRILKEWGLEAFNLRDGTSSYSHNENFIPRNLRDYLKVNNYTQTLCREKSIEILFQNLSKIEKQVILGLWPNGSDRLKNLFISRSVSCVEICYDLESPAPLEFAHQRDIKESFDKYLKKTSHQEFNATESTTFPEYEFKPINAISEQDKGLQIIRVNFWDDTYGKIYTKERSKGVVLNRIERTFNGRAQIKRYCKTRFRSKEDFKTTILILAQETFKALFPIMNISVPFNKESIDLLIHQNCRDHFGKYAPDAISDLTTGSCYIGTGKEGKSLKPVQNKARALAKSGIFLRCERRGIYKVDMNKIKSCSRL